MGIYSSPRDQIATVKATSRGALVVVVVVVRTGVDTVSKVERWPPGV